jgi:hypothetical protein
MQWRDSIFCEARAPNLGGKSHVRGNQLAIRRYRGRQIDAIVNRLGKIEGEYECLAQYR